MQKCYVCGGKGSFKHIGRGICRKCFVRNIERRVKKHLRNAAQSVAQVGPPRYRRTLTVKCVPPRQRLFKKGDRILVIGEVEKVLLEGAVKGMPLEMVFRKRLPRETKKFDYVVMGNAMDGICEEFLSNLFKGRLKVKKEKLNVFNILEPLTEEEVKSYAEIKGIKFKFRKRKKFG